MFSGYFMDPIPKFMKSNACYNLNSGWTNAAWQCTYGYVYTEVQKAEKNFYGNDNLKGYLGITEILKVELMHRIADTYGPLVYHQLGETLGFTDCRSLYTLLCRPGRRAAIDKGNTWTRAVTTTNSKSMIC